MNCAFCGVALIEGAKVCHQCGQPIAQAPPKPQEPEMPVAAAFFNDVADAGALEKIPTGIAGLDHMLRGGLIKERPYLLAGGPGAGKTIFCMQFLKEGLERGEPGLYVTLEEPPSELKNNLSQLGWSIENLRILDGTPKLRDDIWALPEEGGTQEAAGGWAIDNDDFMGASQFNLANLIRSLAVEIDFYQHKRMVIDSLTSIRMLYDTESVIRRELLTLLDFLATAKCTCMLISETLSPGQIEMEGFYARGIINLVTLEKGGKKKRAIEVAKMRGTSFDEQRRPMIITKGGINVYHDESVFSDLD